MNLWIVGQYRGDSEGEFVAWDFEGVYATEAEAVAACETDQYFVGPATLGQRCPDGPWPGAYYPKAKESESDEQRK